MHLLAQQASQLLFQPPSWEEIAASVATLVVFALVLAGFVFIIYVIFKRLSQDRQVDEGHGFEPELVETRTDTTSASDSQGTSP